MKQTSIATDPVARYVGKSDLQKSIIETQRKIEAIAMRLSLLEAAWYRRDKLMPLKGG